MRHRIVLIAGLLLALGAFAPSALAGTRDSSPIHPGVDCVTQSATTYDATFSYRNDNATAQTVAVGSDNYFTPPPIERGQTTTFQPGTVHNAFTVKAIPNATKLTWTVSLNGRAESASVSSSSSHACTTSAPQIHVSVDCVTRNTDTYDATFAYVNDNTAVQTVLVGSDNYFAPPPIERGQTTAFQPGTHHAAFTVAGIPNAMKLVWTVAFGGHTDTATASATGRSCTPTVKRIEVFVDCVTRTAGSYDATFGYENANTAAQTIAVGSDNFFSPPPIDRGQTTSFQPGKVHNAFTVKGIASGTKLVWTVNSGGRSDTATASSDSRSCTPTVKRIEVFVDCVTRGTATYDATFGYENENAAAQTILVGSDNYFSPPPIDRSQTTSFQPGKVRGAFTVKGVPNGTKLVWTVSSGGKTDTATTTGHGRSCAPTTPPAKVPVCHRSDSKWVLITVSPSSLDAHLLKGDVLPGPAGCPATPPKKHHKKHDEKHGDGHTSQARQEQRR